MATMLEDLRFAARILRKNPGFTAVAILTLALAIGANTAIFSVVNGVLLRPLPFPEPDRLFQVFRRNPEGINPSLSVPQYTFLTAQGQPFSKLTAYPALNSGFNLGGDGPTERILGARVTQPFFEVLGIQPALGRGFLPEEDVAGGPKVAVLSHGLWQRRFGGSPDIIGRTLSLNGEPYTIVGVARPGFQHPEHAQLWTPAQLDPASTEDAHYLAVIGRLKPGVDAAQVGPVVKVMGEQIRASRLGAVREDQWLDADRLQTLGARDVKPALLVLLGAVGLVLLIACVNMANLQLARAAARERELAVRAALGASPGRIMGQLLTESLLLSGAGGALGLLLATWALPALLALAPEGIPIPEEIRIDGAVLGFTLGLSVLTGLLFGLLPAWQASRPDLQGSLKVSASRATSGPTGNRTRRLLVVSEVALAVILLVGASLLVKSFATLSGVAPGLDPENVLTMKLSLPEARYGTPEALQSFAHRVLERVRSIPGVEAASFAPTLPFGAGADMDFAIVGRYQGLESKEGQGKAHYRPVMPGYFETLKIGLVRGRLLADTDQHGSAPVVIINESAARRYWPGEDPLGQRIIVGQSVPQFADMNPREIVGIVRDVHEIGLEEEPPAILYLPVGQMPVAFSTMLVRLLPQGMVVRAPGDTAPLAAAVQREIWAVDSMQPVTDIVSMEEIVARSLGSQRFNTLLLGLMAGLALVLAAVGIYGVLSYLVNQRTRELGVRLALGATRTEVVWLVLRQSLSTVGVGVALGMVGAIGLTWLLERLLYSVSALDPVAFLAAPVVLVGVALVSTWLPAWRAARVDPMVALRSE
jgi:putative ABC transport system permease protein